MCFLFFSHRFPKESMNEWMMKWMNVQFFLSLLYKQPKQSTSKVLLFFASCFWFNFWDFFSVSSQHNNAERCRNFLWINLINDLLAHSIFCWNSEQTVLHTCVTETETNIGVYINFTFVHWDHILNSSCVLHFHRYHR